MRDPSNETSECEPIANCTAGHYYGNHCELCDKGFFVKDGRCSECPTNCARCTDENTCVECQQGTRYVNNNCELVDNCTRSSNLMGCVECADGFYLKSDGTCDKCQPQCKTCSNGNYCYRCSEGYYFTDIDNGVCFSLFFFRTSACRRYTLLFAGRAALPRGLT